MSCMLKIFLAIAAIQTIVADVYMHNPRGSNDRNCERNVNRNNGNRLFNSQNNNNGGYACPRAVGNGDFQAEDGTASFQRINDNGDTTTFTQSKRLYYYSGSVLPIEWTNQHGCGGNSKVSCEIVLQYACEDTLDPMIDNFWPWVTNKAGPGSTYFGKQHFRSGTNIAAPRDGVPIDQNDAATDTINDDEQSAIPNTANTRRYGMQESYDYYQLCQRTSRNRGLYTADQQVNRNDRRGTRQNPNGNRHGFECPEERDYYPWWAPSPWIDIAVLTDSASNTTCFPHNVGTCTKRCQYYMNNTMNFNAKGYCDVAHDGSQPLSAKINSRQWQNNQWFNNRADCEKNGFTWYMISHSDNLNFPANNFVCARTQFARVNQLGNAYAAVISENDMAGVTNSHVTEGLNANRFMWTIPQIPTPKNASAYFKPNIQSAYKSCVLRIRYNVSSADFQQWPIEAVNPGTARMVDSKNNSRTSTDPQSPLHQDPYVTIGAGADATKTPEFVKLKVNTNQYGRTFQDRSYVFSIKPLPTTGTQAADNMKDVPFTDFAAVHTALANGGKIYNVNVRGKRGNIVQVFPSVEYDFVPNALALGKNDVIHFQWTGSDYNPQRGCNDATGGPPDPNDFQTGANANQNSRADRSNIVFMDHMGNNVPKDYLGYYPNANMTWAAKRASANATILANSPCYDPATDSQATGSQCYDLVMRLAYLNQQKDMGSLTLRGGKSCLTQQQLNAIGNQDTADNHPLNCAKMNAKPYPYFDGGLMIMKKNGWFPYYSSRNNNFSNRQNIGVICVGDSKTCKVDANGILQDKNPMTNGNNRVATAASTCVNTAGGASGANANGAHSCLPATTTSSATKNTAINSTNIITGETFAVQEMDNDALGSGSPKGCSVLMFSDSTSSVESDLALAFILLAVGLFFSWLAYYLYNRYQARRAQESKFRYDTAWQKAEPIEKARPKSVNLSEINPGVKMGRPTKPPTSPGGKGPAYAPVKGSGAPKVKRTEMI